MALIVEDGTGKTDSESYASVAEADTYHTNFGNAGWAGTTAVKEVALRNATQFLDTEYHIQWKGRRVDDFQALDWPRAFTDDEDGFAIASDVIPTKLKNATIELALSALTESLNPVQSAPVGSIKLTRKKLGLMETETEFAGGASQRKKYRKVNDLLIDFIEGIRERKRA